MVEGEKLNREVIGLLDDEFLIVTKDNPYIILDKLYHNYSITGYNSYLDKMFYCGYSTQDSYHFKNCIEYFCEPKRYSKVIKMFGETQYYSNDKLVKRKYISNNKHYTEYFSDGEYAPDHTNFMFFVGDDRYFGSNIYRREKMYSVTLENNNVQTTSRVLRELFKDTVNVQILNRFSDINDIVRDLK